MAQPQMGPPQSQYSWGGDPSISIALANDPIWRDFAEQTTEMIITKPGRRLFPSLILQVDGLDPQRYYGLRVILKYADKNRYRYKADRWQTCGEAAEDVNRTSDNVMYHKEGLTQTGRDWTRRPIDLSNAKLTNETGLMRKRNMLAMQSLRKVIPLVEITDNYGQVIRWQFLEIASFITVTMYNNDSIRQLKEKWNPFARGHTTKLPVSNPRSKASRKRPSKSSTAVTQAPPTQASPNSYPPPSDLHNPRTHAPPMSNYAHSQPNQYPYQQTSYSIRPTDSLQAPPTQSVPNPYPSAPVAYQTVSNPYAAPTSSVQTPPTRYDAPSNPYQTPSSTALHNPYPSLPVSHQTPPNPYTVQSPPTYVSPIPYQDPPNPYLDVSSPGDQGSPIPYEDPSTSSLEAPPTGAQSSILDHTAAPQDAELQAPLHHHALNHHLHPPTQPQHHHQQQQLPHLIQYIQKLPPPVFDPDQHYDAEMNVNQPIAQSHDGPFHDLELSVPQLPRFEWEDTMYINWEYDFSDLLFQRFMDYIHNS